MQRPPVILVCTDFSQGSDDALKSAKNFGARTDGELYILHVSEYPLQWDWVSPQVKDAFLSEKMQNTLREDINIKMTEQLRRCETKATPIIKEGIIYSSIVEEIHELKADYLFLGHKGKSHTPFYLGGVASKMVASSPIPIVVVKKELNIQKVAGLVAPNEVMSNIIAMGELLSRTFDAKLEIVSLWRQSFTQFFNLTTLEKTSALLSLNKEEQEKVLATMKANIEKELSPQTKCTIKVEMSVEKKIAFHLLEILQKDNVDIVVMERQQRGAVEKFLVGSETKRMLEIFPGNLVILPSKSL